jgi:hypothetical protein
MRVAEIPITLTYNVEGDADLNDVVCAVADSLPNLSTVTLVDGTTLTPWPPHVDVAGASQRRE